MSFYSYKTGTIDLTNGSTAVVGHSTLWSGGAVVDGDQLWVLGTGTDWHPYEIQVDGDSAGTLDRNYTGATATGVAYIIFRNSKSRDSVSALSQLLSTFLNLFGQFINSISGAITATGLLSSNSPTAGVGYSTGAGGAITQSTNKSTGVTLDKTTGTITMNNASLAAGAAVSFTLTNSAIAATDIVAVSIKSAATTNSYSVTTQAVGAGSCSIQIHNFTAGALAEAVVLSFAVIKGVAA